MAASEVSGRSRTRRPACAEKRTARRRDRSGRTSNLAMAEHSLFRPQAYADDLGRLVGALCVLLQWLHVLFVVHGLSSFIRASQRGSCIRRCGIQSWVAEHSRQAKWACLAAKSLCLVRNSSIVPRRPTGLRGARRLRSNRNRRVPELHGRTRRPANGLPGRGTKRETRGLHSPARRLPGTCCKETESGNGRKLTGACGAGSESRGAVLPSLPGNCLLECCSLAGE